MIIKDGKGRGYLAEVNGDQQLEVNAVLEKTYAFISRSTKRAYVASSGLITTDGTANNVFILRNPSSTYNVILVQIDISCDQNSTIVINLNETYGSGGSEITPVNLNRASANVSVVSSYYGDDLILTGTAENYTNFINLANTPFREEFSDVVILGQNDSISVSLNAAAGNAYVSCKYYEREVE